VCSTISMEQQRIKVRLETRKWGKNITVVEGVDSRSVDLGQLASKLKAVCACGGTVKDGVVILQGDHRDRVRKLLVDYGFPASSIEVH
jgi:translation initiation factor 1